MKGLIGVLPGADGRQALGFRSNVTSALGPNVAPLDTRYAILDYRIYEGVEAQYVQQGAPWRIPTDSADTTRRTYAVTANPPGPLQVEDGE